MFFLFDFTFFLCYPVCMLPEQYKDNVTKIADAKEDFSFWKESRRNFLTSSEVFAYREVDVPPWYAADSNPRSVLDGKLGVEKTFDTYAETSMAHGSYDEENILAKFGHMVGCSTCPDNGLYVNTRWSHIAASIDSFIAPWDIDAWHDPLLEEPELHAELSQDRTLAPYLREYIDANGGVALGEVKKSTSVKWQKEVPIYYISQVKTQISVLEMDYAVIMAETIMRNPEKKWINQWDMRAFVIEHDPAWDLVLDKLNENFRTALDTHVAVV